MQDLVKCLAMSCHFVSLSITLPILRMGGKSVAIGGLLLFAELQKQKYIVVHSLYSWLQSSVLVSMLELVYSMPFNLSCSMHLFPVVHDAGGFASREHSPCRASVSSPPPPPHTSSPAITPYIKT